MKRYSPAKQLVTTVITMNGGNAVFGVTYGESRMHTGVSSLLQ